VFLGPVGNIYSLRVFIGCIVVDMSTAMTLLGLLEPAPSHGYELKRAFDHRFGSDKPLPFGQVYATLGRLERDGLAVVTGTEAGEGPERKRYAITEQGVTDLERWLAEAEAPEPHLQTVLFTKVVLALLSGRDANGYLDTQRAAHLGRMRELTELRRTSPLTQSLLADYALFHLEADLRWLELTAARLDELAGQVRS
jgi:DNA-binding PadR family transcriptional regulator